jgi:hypothetical protein
MKNILVSYKTFEIRTRLWVSAVVGDKKSVKTGDGNDTGGPSCRLARRE